MEKRRHLGPEIWGYRLTFGLVGVFMGLCVWVVAHPFEQWSTDLFGFSFYLTQIAGILSGLVAIYTPGAVKRAQ